MERQGGVAVRYHQGKKRGVLRRDIIRRKKKRRRFFKRKSKRRVKNRPARGTADNIEGASKGEFLQSRGVGGRPRARDEKERYALSGDAKEDWRTINDLLKKPGRGNKKSAREGDSYAGSSVQSRTKKDYT